MKKIVLIGYGKMGKEVENVLKKEQKHLHSVINSSEELNSFSEKDCIAIDFSEPAAFRNNYSNIAKKFSGAVIGTTGWNDIEKEVFECFKKNNSSLIYSSNFSVGVNIFFEAVKVLSKMLSGVSTYDPYIIEMHHKQKKDAPSGTAVTVKNIVNEYFKNISESNIASIRSGNIKGIHEVGFESEIDKITIKHEAYSREGFAKGAVVAAKWLAEDNKEILINSFTELLKNKLKLNE